MVRENSGQELERGKSLYVQSEEVGPDDFPVLLLEHGYMLTYASPDDGIECFITKESCEDHMYHYVVAITQKVFMPNHMQTPGTLVFLFSSWDNLTAALPFDISKFRKLALQLVIDAASKVEKQELDKPTIQVKKVSGIVTPNQLRSMRDRKRFRQNGLSN